MAPKSEKLIHEEASVLQAVVLAECDTDYGAAITQYNSKVGQSCPYCVKI